MKKYKDKINFPISIKNIERIYKWSNMYIHSGKGELSWIPYYVESILKTMSFGENLKNVRKQRGVTQEELAEILGVSRQAISKWESDSGYPETEKLLLLSKTLNISLDYLMNDASEMQKKEQN